MSRKTSAARREAFFRALAETGNQTIAAERAKVSRSWVTLHRSTDPGFRARMDAAIEAARRHFDRLSANGEGKRAPPSGWGSLNGEELVVKGTGGAGGGKRVQIARARLRQWTPRAEARFLAVLAATCNVKAACAEVGLTPASAYAHRKRWRRFAALWDEALETGYARIEIALVEAGCNLFSAPEAPPEIVIEGMNVAQAIHVLHMHKHRVRDIGGKPGRWAPPPSLNDPAIRAGILRKLEAIANAEDISRAERAADERAWRARREGG